MSCTYFGSVSLLCVAMTLQFASGFPCSLEQFTKAGSWPVSLVTEKGGGSSGHLRVRSRSPVAVAASTSFAESMRTGVCPQAWASPGRLLALHAQASQPLQGSLGHAPPSPSLASPAGQAGRSTFAIPVSTSIQALFSHFPYPWPLGTTTDKLGFAEEDGEHSTSSDSSSVQDEDRAGPVLPARFPSRKAYRCGSAKGLDVDSDDCVALAVLEADKFAATSHNTNRIRCRWWESRAKARGIDPYPLTVEKINLAAALLKKGHYRSAPAYIAAIKREHILTKHPWCERLTLVVKEAVRSTLRGLGPPKQAQPFQLLSVAQHLYTKKLCPGAYNFVTPHCAVIVASWWMLREIELSALRFQDVVIKGADGSCGVATLHLPVTKTDPGALGTYRSLSCACPSVLCPVRALKHAMHRDICVGPRGPRHPVFPNVFGEHLSKKQVVADFRKVARHAGMDEGVFITGHSGRVTGAQMFAEAQVEEPRIMVFGRWGSSAVRKYVRVAGLAGISRNLANEVVIKSFKPSTDLVKVNTSAQTGASTHEGPTPFAVRCQASGRLHVVRDLVSTHCGWNWSSAPDIYRPAPQEAIGNWCKHCAKVEDRLKARKGVYSRSCGLW